jgi:chemotaxis family two-component system sensor histidine kinase/response regulator PixL
LDFDALEMDSYGSMYSMIQTLLEQMIQLEEAVDDIALYAKQSGQIVEEQRQMLNRIRDELMWARMLPLGEVLNRFPRTLRDLSLQYNKSVNLKLTGTGVLVDKAALEKLYDPLLHLLRNAFDHGIESPQERRKKGKPEEGQIEIRAYHQGNQTIIEVKDDGRGLALDKISHKAVQVGLLSEAQAAVASKEQLFGLVFEAGFSTATKVSELSGRGVGLDVVRSQLQALKGTITVNSTLGEGATFILRLPLTLTIDKLLVCLVEKTAFAIPSDSIEEIVVPEPSQIKTSGVQKFLHWQGILIPLHRLADLLEYHCHLPGGMLSKTLAAVPMPEDWGLPLLLLRRGSQLFAIEVDRLVTEQELVIKPFSSSMAAPSYTYGCTILGDGTLIPVINGSLLLEQPADLRASGGNLTPITPVAGSSRGAIDTPKIFQSSTILVVDDSAAMRRTLALSLEKAGYRVLQARDGKDALEQLQQGAAVQLIICDIEMPNMNGFEFLGQRRRESALMKIPVAMLTSRSNDKHRKLAMHLGASAYFTKPYIEQKFLDAINKLVRAESLAEVE